MIQNLFNEMTELLRKQAPDFFVNDKLNKNKVADAAYSYDKNLLKALLTNDSLKKQFFVEVEKNLVFKQREFLLFLNNKSFLQDSYTRFKNEIGLQDEEGRYFRENTDVVLVWPHKDCVLEGGQTKEDQSREEVFYNETLAPDEIDRLLDTKALTNFALFDKNGKKELKANTEFNIREQNLIIRGNNLLALHSLKARKDIAGKVKLIYIDPPYNTGNDEFKYNDKFNKSSWLTFAKNRISIAKNLLADDGFIFINIDDNQEAYLSIICDEVFGLQNRYDKISVKTSASQGGFGDVNPGLISNTENILLYVKNKKKAIFNEELLYAEKEYDENYTQILLNPNEEPENWVFENLNNWVYRETNIHEPYNNQTWRKLKEIWGEDWMKKRYLRKAQLADENRERVFRTFNPNKPAEYLEKALIQSKKLSDKIVVAYSKDDKKLCLNGEVIIFYSSIYKSIDGSNVPAQRLSTFWNDIPWEGISNEGGVKLRNGKKPEKLLRRIIEITTRKNDIVLDFHLGSGTTAAVAHKLNRRYIGIEQLDYGDNDSVVRLQNVINGDQTGISKLVGWKEGGQFLYCELKEFNQKYIKEIQSAKKAKDLWKIWETMKSEAFLRIEIDKDKFTEDAFNQLEIDEQKRLLLETLDKNHLYVNLSELEDEEHKMTKDEIALNKKFYNIS